MTHRVLVGVTLLVLLGLLRLLPAAPKSVPLPVDPGPRPGPSNAGMPLPGLTPGELALFLTGLAEFAEVNDLGEGLGPRFNLNSCAGCHPHPAIGGTSPARNPQVAIATLNGARNTVPPFITPTGPIREARFLFDAHGQRDGSVTNLFVTSGMIDAGGSAVACPLMQPDFATEVARHNVSFRIPTPLFGAGLIEQIPDATILANLATTAVHAQARGIHGKVNRQSITGTTNLNGNDGTITRFGWKAQNKSLLLFAGEAYNVEMGVTNELFQTERDETAGCQTAPEPNNVQPEPQTPADITVFAAFMRFLDQPRPSPDTPGGAASIARGRAAFSAVGCADCHTVALMTGDSTVGALHQQRAVLWSDLALHGMGPGLADGVSQGLAAEDEFRTAPLWGVGQRLFFLHDGRTTDLVQAILAHASGHGTKNASEANDVIAAFQALPLQTQQDIVHFLRAL
jgi:CxxC motif-containing protein (DUF1111 family)